MTVQDYIRGDSAVNIAASIEAAIHGGKLAGGTALPAIRAVAQALEVSPTTVAQAYRLLAARGLVAADGRRGTRVVAPEALAPAWTTPVPAGVRDVASGNPNPALLPPLGPALARLDPKPRLYGQPLNLDGLVAWAKAALGEDGIEAPSLTVTGGGLDGIERVLREHLRPGDRVALEDPCFPGVLELVRGQGLEVVPAAIDDEGLLPEALDRALGRGARALVLTPRAQNPTGAATTRARAALLRPLLARRPDVLVVEDDHAGPVCGAPLVSLTPGRARWAFVRSVSKWLGPDLRLALVAGDAFTLGRIEGRQSLGIRWVSHVLQELVLGLATLRGAEARLARATEAYARRRQALIAALERRSIPARGRSGLNVWIPVADEGAAVQRLLALGYAVRPGERFRLASPPGIRITTAALEEKEAPALAAAVASAIAAPSTAGGA